MDKTGKRLEKLIESVEILRDIFDTENYGMYIVDKAGKLLCEAEIEHQSYSDMRRFE